MAKIYHAHLYGSRDSKYDWLQTHDVLSTNWQDIQPQAPFYLLIPQNTDLLSEYEQGWKITDVMPVNSTGVKTHRDHFVIDFDASKLRSRIAEFRDLAIPDEVIAQRYSLSDTRDWKINVRRRSLANNHDWEKYLTKCLYRPFDMRAYYHHQDVVELPRNEVMRHIINCANLSLITSSRVEILRDYDQVFCSDLVVQNHTLCIKEVNYLFPLYLYPDRTELTQDRRPNFSPEFLKDLTDKLGTTPSPEAIFYYIYAVFHSPTYRRRYAEFLKIDFPRVPLTRNAALFQQLAAYGEALVALHLMKSAQLDSLITQYQGNAEPVIDPGYPKFVPHPLTPATHALRSTPKQGEGEQEGSAPLSPLGRGAGGEGSTPLSSPRREAGGEGSTPLSSPRREAGGEGSTPLSSPRREAGGEGSTPLSSPRREAGGEGSTPLSSPRREAGGEGSTPLSSPRREAGGESGTVLLNKKGDGFTGVPEEVWNFYVGGYQVCHKWLKDRKGRTLSPEDITHYQRIVVALQETIHLMQQIDEAIPDWPLE